MDDQTSPTSTDQPGAPVGGWSPPAPGNQQPNEPAQAPGWTPPAPPPTPTPAPEPSTPPAGGDAPVGTPAPAPDPGTPAPAGGSTWDPNQGGNTGTPGGTV